MRQVNYTSIKNYYNQKTKEKDKFLETQTIKAHSRKNRLKINKLKKRKKVDNLGLLWWSSG